MIKYDKVVRYGKQNTKAAIDNGSDITIYEKLDGSNASFKSDNGVIKSYSRNRELDDENTLRGFKNWVDENIDAETLPEDMVLYGEWLKKHTINYPEEAYGKFYLFDVYDVNTETYLDYKTVKNIAEYLFINLCPVFYQGEYKGIEHIQSFVGKSMLGGEEGEGVVAKSYPYKNRLGEQMFVKFVSEKFSEKAKSKVHKIKKDQNSLEAFVDTYLTKGRVEKILHKLVDESILDRDFDITDMKTILTNGGGRVSDDILEEEDDELFKLVRRAIGKKLPMVVKEVLKDREEVS